MNGVGALPTATPRGPVEPESRCCEGVVMVVKLLRERCRGEGEGGLI